MESESSSESSTTCSISPALQPEKAACFQRADWLAAGLTALIALIVYGFALAPQVTLRDSGELSTGAFYLGVPHNPGYPVWVLYAWVFSKALFFCNVAKSIGWSSAFAAALAAGLIALLVSQGWRRLLPRIAAGEHLPPTAGANLRLACAVAAGLLFAFSQSMWSQAVIVEVHGLSALSLMLTLTVLFRWMHSPGRTRYLCLLAFLFGVSIVNHQDLLLAGLGLVVAVVLVRPGLGRDLFFAGTLIYVAALVMKAKGSWLLSPYYEFGLTVSFLVFWGLGLISLSGCILLTIKTRQFLKEFKPVLLMLFSFTIGLGLYLLVPIFSMTNPPINWGYPRWTEGFWHVMARGQYSRVNPSDFFSDPGRTLRQLCDYGEQQVGEFGWIALVGAAIFLIFLIAQFLRKPRKLLALDQEDRLEGPGDKPVSTEALPSTEALDQDRPARPGIKPVRSELAWLLGLLVAYAGLSALFVLLLNSGFDLQSRETNRVYLIPSSAVLAMFIGYGLAIGSTWILKRFPAFKVARILPFLILLLPAISLATHGPLCSQRGHWFGYWFAHDLFKPPFAGKDGKPLYPEMARDAILFPGTDSGRFCGTYMVFCESQVPPDRRGLDRDFDRRDVYLITQNALADGTYLNYIRAHYQRSRQVDAPFFQELLRSSKERSMNPRTNFLARLVSPLDSLCLSWGESVEKKRRTESSHFKQEHFTNLPALASKLRTGGAQGPLSKFVQANLSPETIPLLASPDDRLAEALARDLNRLLEGVSIYASDRFEGVRLKETTAKFLEQNPAGHGRIRLNRLLLEEAYPEEIAKSLGGLYPDREIRTPSAEDSQRAFNEYLEDVQTRMKRGELRPGEDARDVGGRFQVSGQVAVVAINALLTKMVFDRNPDHEFYVEESFPLDWMYPHLEPYGTIMRINRNPMRDLSQEKLDRDHEFWSQYTERLIGDWITYDTPVSDICQFVERVYLRRDYSRFETKCKFFQDPDAQKAFSKLRSSIGGIYAWRLQAPDFQYRPKTPEAREAMMREAELAFKQSLALCPTSPESVFRYVNLLLITNPSGRIEDALLIARTWMKLDPRNPQAEELVRKLEEIELQHRTAAPTLRQLAELENRFKTQTTVSNAFALAQSYVSLSRTSEAVRVLSTALDQSNLDNGELVSLANAFAQLNEARLLERTLERITKLAPENPEAWYDLAAVQALQGKRTNSLASLQRTLALNAARRKDDPKARDLKAEFLKDDRFKILRNEPEFSKLIESF